MNDFSLVCGSKAVSNLEGVIRGVPHWDWAFFQTLAQVFSLEQFGDNVGHTAFEADIVNRQDVRVVEGGGGSRLLFEAAQMIRIVAGSRPNQLQCDIASQPLVACAKDFAHASRTDLFEDPVVPQELASHR